MLKSVILYVLLWHEMCEFSSHAERRLTDARIPNFSVVDFPESNNTVETKATYNVNASHQVINANGSSFGRAICRNLNSTRNITRNDYVVTNGIGAHKLHRDKLTWSRARRACADEGAHLAVIRSEAEENVVLKMMIDHSVTNAWLGYHDQFEEGDWVSVFDEKINEGGWENWSKKWSPNPDNHGNQDCAALLSDGGGMDDQTCDVPTMFLCKISTF